MKIADNDFNRLTEFIRNNYGIELSKKRALIEGRLGQYITNKGFNSFESFVNYVLTDTTGIACEILTSKLTTNYTFFMREENHFYFLYHNILPSLEDSEIRIWSAATGEEAYSIAMTTHDYITATGSNSSVKITASDISKKVISEAKEGIYSTNDMGRISAQWLSVYFSCLGEDKVIIKDEIKRMVSVCYVNLIEPFPFKKRFHIIFCRNVMIYFNIQTKIELVKKLYDSLETGGYLIISHSESLNGISDDFTYIKPSVYRKDK